MEALTAKDDLTLMIRSLHPRTGEFDLFELFSTVGKVNDVKMISDERTGKSLGVAYVEMADEKALDAALALSGQTLMGSSILVQRSLAIKNRLSAAGADTASIRDAGIAASMPVDAHAAAAAAALLATAAPPKQAQMGVKIYVGGLDFAFDEHQIESVFIKFGPIQGVHLQRDHASGMSKGFCFIHFVNSDDGHRCCQEMDGVTLAGRIIKVNISGNQNANQMPQPQLPPVLNANSAAAVGFNQSLQLGAGSGGLPGLHNPPVNDHYAVTNLDGLDSDGGKGGGEKINASQRANLLMKLAASADMAVPDATRKVAAQGGIAIGPNATDLGGSDSRCVVLKNMFDRLAEEVEANPNFFAELSEDVRGECAKLGTVLFCAADKWSNGFVYIKMLANAEASRVKELMHGRYFAKNKILAAYVGEPELDRKFKLVPTSMVRRM